MLSKKKVFKASELRHNYVCNTHILTYGVYAEKIKQKYNKSIGLTRYHEFSSSFFSTVFIILQLMLLTLIMFILLELMACHTYQF